MKRRYYLAGMVLVLAALVAAALAYPHLPEQIATHWNLQGEADDFGPRWMIFVIGPGIMALMLAVFALLPWLSPRHFEVESFLPTYLRLMLLVVAMCGYFFAVMLAAGLTGSLAVDRALVGGIAVLLVLFGNLMGKVRRNFYLGIRTPWTLASERVWHATHRLAGRSMVVAGLVALAIVLAGGAVWTVAIALGAGLLLPVVFSLVHYKQLERRGELEAR
jgi:uncharacterized membrane protein